MGICWLSQNRVGGFCWSNFTLLCLLATLEPKKFVPCCLGMFGILIYYCLANRIYLVISFARKKSSLLNLNPVCYNHYLSKKVSLYIKILISLQTCLFVIGKILFLPVLTG